MEAKLAARLADALGFEAAGARLHPLGHGFGTLAKLETRGRSFFTKRLPIPRADPLDAEADGLRRLAEPRILRVPAVQSVIDLDDQRWLILEWLELGALTAEGAARLGRNLAEQHWIATADPYGLDRDNWLGANPQVNTPTTDWTRFLFDHRIGALLHRLGKAGTPFAKDALERLTESWQREFADYRPVPSLLHGDLWGGNAGMLADGTPAVFDPAVHYGDRECDLAMAALFGGFGSSFFDAYEERWPLDPGWEHRRRFYQLYHVLNHALLFGGSYVADAQRRIHDLLHGRQ